MAFNLISSKIPHVCGISIAPVIIPVVHKKRIEDRIVGQDRILDLHRDGSLQRLFIKIRDNVLQIASIFFGYLYKLAVLVVIKLKEKVVPDAVGKSESN